MTPVFDVSIYSRSSTACDVGYSPSCVMRHRRGMIDYAGCRCSALARKRKRKREKKMIRAEDGYINQKEFEGEKSKKEEERDERGREEN